MRKRQVENPEKIRCRRVWGCAPPRKRKKTKSKSEKKKKKTNSVEKIFGGQEKRRSGPLGALEGLKVHALTVKRTWRNASDG